MKQLFIIIFLFNFYSPVIAQETGAIFKHETYTNFASKGFEDDETKSNYSGKINNWGTNAKIL